MVVPFRQVEKQAFHFHGSAPLQKQLYHVCPQSSEAFEDEIGVFVFRSGEFKCLEEFKRCALRGGCFYDEFTIPVFADAKIIRQEIRAHMTNAFKPLQSPK